VKISLKETRLGLRNSTTRLPFRYGSACLTRCPQAIQEVTIEVVAAGSVAPTIQRGWSGDCLPPLWFDKSPDRSYRQQIDDMLGAADIAAGAYRQAFSASGPFFPAWLDAHQETCRAASERGYTDLLASFGSSLLERALLDAVARAAGVSFNEAVRKNLPGVEPAAVHPSLAGLEPREWLPKQPLESVFVRHTVGLGDPLTAGDILPEDRLDDGLPQALEEYLDTTGLRYFKVKLANDPPRDAERLRSIARLLASARGEGYQLTLDGNEQYRSTDELRALYEMFRTPELAALWRNTLAIEQPLARSIALDEGAAAGIAEFSAQKPIIIDEADAALGSYARALGLGYRGVSSKNCKGALKSLLNMGLTWLANDRGRGADFLMTGEDLCSVGIVPVQADLCLAATLGLAHVERNGHHYHRGLSYLPPEVQRQALAAHGDFYHLHGCHDHGDFVAPRLSGGRFEIGSLQCVGFGFGVEPNLADMTPAERWRFESLGL